MVQKIKVSAAKSDELNSFPRTHVVEEENRLSQAFLKPSHVHKHAHTHTF